MNKGEKYLFTYCLVTISIVLTRILFIENIFGDIDSLTTDILFTLLAQILCMGFIPIIAIISLRGVKDGREELRERLYLKRVRGYKVWLIVLGVAILHPFINGGVSTVWSYLLDLVGYTYVLSSPVVYSTVWQFLLGLFLSALLPAIFEEVTHRGLLLSATRGRVHKRVLLTAIAFALMHQNITQTAYTFVGGLIMGYLTVYTGSIIPAMVTHFINNAFVEIRIFSASNGGIISQILNSVYASTSSPLWVAVYVVLWVACVVGVVWLLRRLKKLRAKGENTEELATVVESKDSSLAWTWGIIFTFLILSTLFSLIWGLIR